ncbi:hypothetical protein L208DRAFT_1127622, partial [Tricholoma matsutake]
SQMTAAFTQHYAHELELEEQCRAADALQIECHNKAKHNVIVYGWAKSGGQATVSKIQGNFKWPHFVLTADVLSEVDLLMGPEAEAHVKLYKDTIGTWVKVRLGHVVTLKDRDRVFFKGLDILECPDFDCLLSQSHCQPTHFMNNLPKEWAFVQQVLQEQ